MATTRRAGAVAAALERARAARVVTTYRSTVVIVGAGIAGFRAAERLRERGFDGRIVIVGDEAHRPYNRTPLSKQLLAGTGRLDDLRLTAYHDPHAIWRLGTRANGLDPARKVVILPGGEELSYDGLIIATGVEARHLPGAPMSSSHVWSLRTLDEGRAVSRRVFAHARHVVVVGSGFIGCEVAASLRARGLEVSLVGRGSYLLGKAVGPLVGGIVTKMHRHAGVHLHLGRNPVAWATADEPSPGRKASARRREANVQVLLDDGSRLRADLAIVAVGSIPSTDWLRGSGLDISDGVLTGPTCHAMGPAGPVADIVVAGDVARLPNVRFDQTPRRVEHWITAAEHGQAAADALLAGPGNARFFTPMPRFWTEQHHVRIQSVGRPALSDACTITEGSVRDMSFVACYTRAGIVVGAVSFNASRELLDYAELVGQPLAAPAHQGLGPAGAVRPTMALPPGGGRAAVTAAPTGPVYLDAEVFSAR